MDVVISQLSLKLSDEIAKLVDQHLQWLRTGDFAAVLTSADAELLFGTHTDGKDEDIYDGERPWSDWLFERLSALISDRSKPELQMIYFCIGYAALLSFVQAGMTGPPLPFTPFKTLFSRNITSDTARSKRIHHDILTSMTRDGIAAYKLTPNLELLCVADVVFTNPAILKNIPGARWARLRSNLLHQRLLSETSSTLQTLIYDDLALVLEEIQQQDNDTHCQFLLERAAIHLHHGMEKIARDDIEEARKRRYFEYRLTGRLGKRTRFQVNDTSQLVVLAKSNDENRIAVGEAQPESIDLNDETLLERIAFTKADDQSEALPSSLAELDPSNQPQLQPLDSIILLSFASSITNTSPEDGLTREELLPYANRVLDGGSSNWQVYTQALLVRSRVEGYRSRTVERGLLQLQALVDQVIAETTSIASDEGQNSSTSTFLPRAKQAESAPVMERLRYVFQLASPSRWDLESELASRWVSLGGLRSALEIYERLEMWAEAALCWAAVQNEDKARKIVRRQLFHRTSSDTTDEEETWTGLARNPAPLDAPRLYCILGDMDSSLEMYETAWTVSGHRYARAQRALGRHYFASHDYEKAAEAYAKSLKVNQLNHQSWFALGCALIELEQYHKAVEAFSRCVQLDDSDAEAWSNLAAALLRIDSDGITGAEHALAALDDDFSVKPVNTQQNRVNALKAFQRAATLKNESYRIWQNILVTAASLSPPDFTAALSAQRRVIELRGKTDGEKCIDIEILERLVQYAIASADSYDASLPGFVRMTVRFVDESVVPLITASADLWRIVSKLALWRKRPATALEAEEKAWRAITTQPGWETGDEKRWDEVVEATIRLCDSYESLGPQERTEGLSAGSLVTNDWKFKARSAVRGIMNRSKDTWQDSAGWNRLQDTQNALKG